MDGEIAQICNIVLATKSALKKRSRIKYKPVYYEKKSTFIFFNNKKYKAKSVEEWFDYCLNLELEDIKILLPVSSKNLNIPNDLNTSKIKIICYFKNNLILYFTPKWEKTSGGWNIIYTAHKYESSINGKLKFYDNTEDFKNTLSRIATLADKIDFQNFANIFTKAYDMLDGKEIENYFYKKYFSLLPEINARLFCSAGISDVFAIK